MPIYIPKPESITIVAFLKFGKREHMQALRDRGTLYMNTLSHFAKLENDQHRGDRDEGLTRIIQPSEGGTLTITDNKTGKVLKGSFETGGDFQLAEPLRIGGFGPEHNIYSFFTIAKRHGFLHLPIMEDYCKEFPEADSFALIRKPSEFIPKVLDALRKLPVREITWGMVEYPDFKTYSGEVGPFRKDIRFAYQKEFRFAITSPTGKPVVVEIGDLSDCIVVGKIEELDTFHVTPTYEPLPVPIATRPDFSDQRQVSVIGNLGIPDDHKTTAFFCSTKCPGDLILKTYDLAQAWRDKGEAIIGGFHTPMEKEVLPILFKGTQPVVICPARGIGNIRLPAEWKAGIDAKRLLILSPFEDKEKRPTAALAEERNRFVAAVADRLFIAYAHLGGKTEALAREALAQGKPVFTFDHPATANLREMGVRVDDLECGSSEKKSED